MLPSSDVLKIEMFAVVSFLFSSVQCHDFLFSSTFMNFIMQHYIFH